MKANEPACLPTPTTLKFGMMKANKRNLIITICIICLVFSCSDNDNKETASWLSSNPTNGSLLILLIIGLLFK